MERPLTVFVVLFWHLLFAISPVQAQSAKAHSDSVKQVVKEIRARLVIADSTQDAATSMDLRSHLAELVPRAEAIKLLTQAAGSAHYDGSLDKEIEIRSKLSELYTGSGKAALSLLEAQRIRALIEQRERLGKLHHEQESAKLTFRYRVLRDSLNAMVSNERDLAQQQVASEKARTGLWRWVAIAFGALWVLTAVFLFHRSRQAHARSKAEIGQLRSEVQALKDATAQQQPNEPAGIKEPDVVPTTVEGSKGQVIDTDPIALAIFRKMLPERLSTLKAARSRNDHEKVVRVVHTLKPHLVHLDPDTFGPLCSALTKKGAPERVQEWNADLDTLVKKAGAVQAG